MWTFLTRGKNSDFGRSIFTLELRKLSSRGTGKVLGSHISRTKNDGNTRLKIIIASSPLQETSLGVAQTLTFFYCNQE